MSFDRSRASAQISIKINAACFNNDCRNFGWAGVPAYDNNGNPIPAGSTCILKLNQNVWICAQNANMNCAATTPYISTGKGTYIDPGTGAVLDCSYYAYNC